MNEDETLVNREDILAHIAALLEDVAMYMATPDRPDYIVADFIDNVRNLDGLLTTLGYTTVKEEFFDALRTI